MSTLSSCLHVKAAIRHVYVPRSNTTDLVPTQSKFGLDLSEFKANTPNEWHRARLISAVRDSDG